MAAIIFVAADVRGGWPQAVLGTSTPMPANADRLDGLLNSKKYLELGNELKKTMDFNAVELNLNWEANRLFRGKSAILGYAYAHDLWRVAQPLSEQQGRGIKATAVMALLYTSQVVAIDGAKCEDATAPQNRHNQIFSVFRHIWQFVPTMTEEERTKAIEIAVRLEEKTAPLRSDDDFLCRDGFDQMRDAIEKHGNKPLEDVPNTQGNFGRTVAVPDNPNYEPKFVSKDVWMKRQAEVRPRLRNALAKILDDAAKAK